MPKPNTPETKEPDTQQVQDGLEKFNMEEHLTQFNEENLEGSGKDGEGGKKGGKQPPNAETQPTKETEDKEWLIKDRFEDTPEGREAMAKSYRDMQSKADKTQKELDSFSKIDHLMQNDPEGLIKVIKQSAKIKDKNEEPESNAPELPEGGLDSLDQFTPGTPTYEYLQQKAEYDRQVILADMAKLVRGEVGEIKQSQQQANAANQEKQALVDMGLSSESMDLFYKVLGDDEYKTLANAVKYVEAVTGEKLTNVNGEPGPGPAPEPKPAGQEPHPPKTVQNKSPISTPGTPGNPPESGEAVKKEVFNNIMRYSTDAGDDLDGLG